jgi:hypothetical protein
MTIIKATSAGFKNIGTDEVRLFFDVPSLYADLAMDLFRKKGVGAAIAALTDESEKVAMQNETIAVAKEPTGQLCREAIGYCKEPMFWEWLEQSCEDGGQYIANNEDEAKASLLLICSDANLTLRSRKELDGDLAAKNFIERIRNPYREWVKTQ